jgi:phosphotriesterase-related protein
MNSDRGMGGATSRNAGADVVSTSVLRFKMPRNVTLSRTMTRREAIALLGVGAAYSAVHPVSHAFAQAKPPVFPKGAVIRTLLKDVPPESITSPALFHEHLSIHYPIGTPTSFSDDVPLIVEEVKLARADGVGLIVDGGHPDMQRDLEALKRIQSESGVPIVGSGGYYMQRSYPAEIARKSVDEIAESLADDAKTGRLGAFGEIGQQDGVLTADETKVFQAVAKAQVKTGLPICTHNAYTGTRPTQTPVPRDAALKQLDVLEAAGGKPAQIAIGHVCCLDDPKAEIAIALARRGVFVGFDRVTIALVPDAQKVTTIMAMVEAGYANHVLLSSDFYSGRSLKKNGGPGIAQTLTVFAPMLLKAGMPEATLKSILVDNSRRFLACNPKV